MIYLIRHGETEWSLSGRHTGQKADLPLTEHGKAEAHKIAVILQDARFGKVFTSPLQRAMKTCEIAGFLEYAEVDPDLMEWDYGDYEGLTSKEIHQKDPTWNLFSQGAPHGESIQQISERADRFWKKIGAPEKDVAIFSSGHFLRVLIVRWLGLPATHGRYFFLETGSITLLGFEHEIKVLISPTL